MLSWYGQSWRTCWNLELVQRLGFLTLGAVLGPLFGKIYRRIGYHSANSKGIFMFNRHAGGERKGLKSRETYKKLPKHIAVIMDGNRRYGREQCGDALQGHWEGGQRLVDFVQWCMDVNDLHERHESSIEEAEDSSSSADKKREMHRIEMVTVYAFSTENWSREPAEVNTLMTIFAKYADTFQHEALSRNIKVNVLSTDRSRL